jgi:hypothetical protein
MARKPDEDADLALVERLVFSKQGLELKRYSRAETLAGRTPDFKVLQNGTIKALCEVKSPRDDWLDDRLAEAPAFELAGGPRKDPTFNRIARHVQKASSQFDAANGSHSIPNILIFINHGEAVGFNDLYETLTGFFRTETGERIGTMPHIAEGRIGEARTKIDLYVWIDARTRSMDGCLFNDLNPGHVSALCELLGLDPLGDRPALRQRGGPTWTAPTCDPPAIALTAAASARR